MRTPSGLDDTPEERGISPVIGVILMVAIVVVLSSVSAVVIFQAQEDGVEPAPSALMEVDSQDGSVTQIFTHEGGERLEGDKLTLKGAADPDVFDGKSLDQGDTVEFVPTSKEVKLIFTGENGHSHVLRTFEVEQTVPLPDKGCPWVEAQKASGSDITVDGIVVNCDIKTPRSIKLTNDALVIGNVNSTNSEVTIEESETIGNVVAHNKVTIPDGDVGGSVTAKNGEAKISEGNISGDVTSLTNAVTLGGQGEVDIGGTVRSEGGSGIDAGGNARVDVGGSMISTSGETKLERGNVSGDVISRSNLVKLGGQGEVDVGGDVISEGGSGVDAGSNARVDIDGKILAKSGVAKLTRGNVSGNVISRTNAVKLGGDGPVDVGGDVISKGGNGVTAGSDARVDIAGSMTTESGTAKLTRGNITGDITSGGPVKLGGDGPVDVGGEVRSTNSKLVLASQGRVDISGSAIAENGNLKLEKGSIGGDAISRNGGTVNLGGTDSVDIGGDVLNENGDVNIYGSGGSNDVEGAVAATGNIAITDTTVDGEAYLDGSLSCPSSTIDEQSCSGYKPSPSYGAYTGP